MTSDYESKDPGVHLQQGYAHTRLDMWIRFGSLHSVCPGDIGYNYRRCFGKESFIPEHPMNSSANDPMDIYMVSLLIPSIINWFLIGLNVYLMNVLHAVWIYFHTLQEHLDQVNKAFRWRQPAIIFVFRSFISQTKHMASENSAWPVSEDSGRENSLHVFKSWKH